MKGSTLRVYLCGSIKKGKEDTRSDFWTAEDIHELKAAVSPCELIVLNPGERQDNLSDVKATFGRDLLQVFTSDAILVDARHRRGVGVGAEMLFAKIHGIPVITVAPPNSHYHRSNVTLMGQFVEDWTHPFISELSDHVVGNVTDAARVAASLDTPRNGKGPEVFENAMRYYLKTQVDREPDMVSLLTRGDGVPSRAAGLLYTAGL
ncbi:MAG TPA: hypothetical protein VMV92_15380 [Streptosporangiaceae bacterium]|nr:hypothetical protein [Streptosporangiaceae bacterium]